MGKSSRLAWTICRTISKNPKTQGLRTQLSAWVLAPCSHRPRSHLPKTLKTVFMPTGSLAPVCRGGEGEDVGSMWSPGIHSNYMSQWHKMHLESLWGKAPEVSLSYFCLVPELARWLIRWKGLQCRCDDLCLTPAPKVGGEKVVLKAVFWQLSQQSQRPCAT